MKKVEEKGPLNKLFNSIDNLLSDEKEQKLRSKLGKEIRKCIFTDDIVERLNENDFSGMVEEEGESIVLFSMIFPIFVEKNGVIFRLYKHKVEVDLSDEMSDRYIYIFSDGRLTSGLFQCFKLYDDEYMYGVKKIIDMIPSFKDTVKEALITLNNNEVFTKEKMGTFKEREVIAKDNFNELFESLNAFK
ncbi:hypothetical protein LL033_06945 [Clostridium estertheticum]|uniref:hypothetical protein n=1 Tax=Clostridium estertheticum TaxID=238834 RepID=UPI001C0D063C|nr:hypothetical protein [Clostridium estertheticum]MBU3215336.1 hypothetical protein [Clostridium estertheticum]WAG56965.1 hypothetical protein LL033_06945 [Clostridium estertheticum]